MFLRPDSLVAYIHSTRDPHFQAHTATESPGTKRASISKTSLDHCTRLVLNESRSSSCWILISCWMLKIEPGFPETGNDPIIVPEVSNTGSVQTRCNFAIKPTLLELSAIFLHEPLIKSIVVSERPRFQHKTALFSTLLRAPNNGGVSIAKHFRSLTG